jgi:alpha-galactosidase
MKTFMGHLTFTHDGKKVNLTVPETGCRHPEATIRTVRQQLPQGELLTIQLTSDTKVELVEFVLEAQLEKPQKMLANGFQTWTQTREFDASQSIPRLFAPGRPLLAPYGDYHIQQSSGRKGQFHSWSWAAFQMEGEQLLLASTSEDQGYTLFEANLITGKLRIRRDCQGQNTDDYPLVQIYIGRGRESALWDEYATLLPPSRRRARRCTGWTSWYNYYTKITEDIIQDNLQALSDTGHPFDVFQIDDGWQGAIGDWLTVNNKFPQGMDTLSRAITAKGYRPGLWLAPFICEAKSKIWRENYDWVLKDHKGRPVKAGWNPGWSGWFYAMDFYAPGYQAWLKEVFDTVFNQWGFQMVKLDFLYAVALRPNNGRCRGRIMADCLEFLHRVCKNNQILGCGVPLAQSAGRVDYCRIGADVAPYWEDRFLETIAYRERVSTKNSLYSTLHRHMLDRRFFRNDPDVFILRDGKPKVNENKLTPNQRHTLFMLNNLLGGLIFLSDHVGEYSPKLKQQLAEMFPTLETDVTQFNCDDDLYRIHFTAANREYLALTNLGDKPREVQLQGSWFHPDTFIINAVTLQPHQSICLTKADQNPDRPTILGSSGHLWPGAQVDNFTQNGEGWTLDLAPHSAPHSKVWIALPKGTRELQVNNQTFPAQNKNGISYIIT